MAFSTALSGLNAAQADLNVTSNNIANANTTGFKQSRPEFVDVFAASFSGVGSTAVGSGVRVSAVTQEFSQGNIEFTSSNLDMAISGDGFFVLSDGGTTTYSRAGAFHADSAGFVVNSQNKRLQVYPPVAGGGFNTGVLNDLQLNTTAGAPNATTLISAGLNLNAADAEIVTPPSPAFSITDPSSFNNSTSVVVYDSLGAAQNATMYFRKVPLAAVPPAGTTANWETRLFIGTEEVNAGGASPQILNFNASGLLVNSPPSINYDVTTTIATGAAQINLDIDYSLLTQFGSPFSVSSLSQDGFTTGQLSGIDIDDQGVVFARFTNGQSNTLGELALARFNNNQGLQPQGDTEWAETFSSGSQILGEASVGTFGLIQSGALESSNVDIAEQLVKLITAQRNYQANAEVISTEDTIAQTIINLR